MSASERRANRRKLGYGRGASQPGRWPRTSPRNAPRHPMAMPLDEYGTPIRRRDLGPLAEEVRRVLR